MKKYINNYIKNKKGLSAIQTGIGVFIVLICICGFIDLTTTMYKFNALSSTATYVTRIIEKQGGIAQTAPKSYRGEFVPTSELYNDVKKIMNASGVADDKWEVYVNGTKLAGTNTGVIRYYNEDIKIEVKIRYSWNMVRNFININKEYEKTVTRYSKSSLIKRESNINSSFN